ncbi:hypothetical protein Tco_0602362 [Tanacetum coccineum]
MELCTNLQTRVLDLEKTKTTQAEEIVSLKRRVKKLEQKKRSRTHRLKRLYKVGLTARVESSGDEESLGEDASKQGRINAIDADEDITLVNDQDDADMFDVNTLTGDEVLAEQEVATKDVNLTVDEVTLALAALKSVKSKVKGDVVEEPSIPVSAASTKVSAATTTTTATIPTPRKGIVIIELEPEKPLKKKDQISFDEQEAIRLQAESYALSWKPCQGDSLNLPDHRIHKDGDGTVFGFPPYPFNYPTRRMTIEEMLDKFIDEELCGDIEAEYACLKKAEYAGLNQAKYDRDTKRPSTHSLLPPILKPRHWETNVKMILEGLDVTKDDRESQLYDEFDTIPSIKGEAISRTYYVRFTDSSLMNEKHQDDHAQMQLNSKEAMVETSEKKIVIQCVLYTPEITLNVLSLDQFVAQGFVVTYGHNKCQISYMFEEDKEGCDGETDCATSKEGNGCDVETESMIAKHNKYLKEYFDLIDSKDACPLIKGLEELKWERNIVQDYLDKDYILGPYLPYHHHIS